MGLFQFNKHEILMAWTNSRPSRVLRGLRIRCLSRPEQYLGPGVDTSTQTHLGGTIAHAQVAKDVVSIRH